MKVGERGEKERTCCITFRYYDKYLSLVIVMFLYMFTHAVSAVCFSSVGGMLLCLYVLV